MAIPKRMGTFHERMVRLLSSLRSDLAYGQDTKESLIAIIDEARTELIRLLAEPGILERQQALSQEKDRAWRDKQAHDEYVERMMTDPLAGKG